MKHLQQYAFEKILQIHLKQIKDLHKVTLYQVHFLKLHLRVLQSELNKNNSHIEPSYSIVSPMFYVKSKNYKICDVIMRIAT